MLLIFLTVLSLTIGSFAQDTNGTTYIVDTEEDLMKLWSEVTGPMSYSDNFSQFIHDAKELATLTDIEPPPSDLAKIEGFQGLWWTLSDEIYESWEGKPTFNLKRVQHFRYLSLNYALCGNSTITVTTGSRVHAIISNTLVDDTTFTCDGDMKRREFDLGAEYGATLEFNVYSNGTYEPGFALIDKIYTTDDPPPTERPRPSSTRHTFTTVPTTTPIPRTTTEESGGGGATFARMDAMLRAVLFVFICATIF